MGGVTVDLPRRTGFNFANEVFRHISNLTGLYVNRVSQQLRQSGSLRNILGHVAQ